MSRRLPRSIARCAAAAVAIAAIPALVRAHPAAPPPPQHAPESAVIRADSAGTSPVVRRQPTAVAIADSLAAAGDTAQAMKVLDRAIRADRRDARAWISRPSDVVEAGRRGVTDAVSGRPLIVDRNRISDELWSFERRNTREPRTAVGVSQDGRMVYLITVDGRRETHDVNDEHLREWAAERTVPAN